MKTIKMDKEQIMNKYRPKAPVNETWTAAYTLSMGWMVRGCKVMSITSSTGFVCGLSEEDAKLIAMAPILLAEVKRLRKRNAWLEDVVVPSLAVVLSEEEEEE